MSKFPSQMQDKFNLRFPEGMRDAVAERAKANGRSMNSEIIEMIRFSMEKRPLWLEDNEILLDSPGGFSAEPASNKNPKQLTGLVLLELQEKIAEVMQIMNESTDMDDFNRKTEKLKDAKEPE